MNYFQRGTLALDPGRRLLAGYALVSIGILMAISGATWDVTYHLLNKPETFFSPPHAILYAGVATALAGAITAVLASRSLRKIEWPAKMVIGGIVLLIAAGPGDFVWHSAFGLDGLLSPPHSVLLAGMLASSIGAAAGIVRNRLPVALLVLGMLPVWLAAAGAVHMFSLPFSESAFFNFNPEPRAGAVVATIGFPFVTAAVLVAAKTVAGSRRFGVMSALAGAFVVTGMLTSIVPNEALASTIPLYVGVLVPLVAADYIMSRWMSPKAVIAAGAMAGLSFLMLYYPLITHTYNETILQERSVWASLTAIIYFDMMATIFPLVAVPAAAMGIAGAIAGQRMAARAQLALLK
ncbi:MAG: hypothetical protein ACREAY_02555 [Nitrososphaera sp.]|uniref:hypothetical protein n=1 Tax=Nitrososphaera sp. TaxID=1971748 RepID=UPI003D6F2F56